jgi:hypothetical protein
MKEGAEAYWSYEGRSRSVFEQRIKQQTCTAAAKEGAEVYSNKE